MCPIIWTDKGIKQDTPLLCQAFIVLFRFAGLFLSHHIISLLSSTCQSGLTGGSHPDIDQPQNQQLASGQKVDKCLSNANPAC